MSTHFLPFDSARIGSRLFHDYISEKSSLSSFYSFSPKLESIETATIARNFIPLNRTQLITILKNQYQDIPVSSKVMNNILSLESDHTFTITTGHQLSLATGPLYFIYKIASVITLTEQCNKHYPKWNFVPVFWMNSEDHDFYEINHIWLHERRFEWQKPTHVSMAVGRMQPLGIEAFFYSLPEKIQALSSFKEWKAIYTSSENLAEATRKLVNRLFGEYGLVVIDQDDVRLKRLAFEVFFKELTLCNSFQPVNETSAALKTMGYEVQVKPREVNLFYHHPQAGRQRIVKNGERIRVLNTSTEFQVTEIAAISDEQLDNLSTNVVTRPMYQQTVLPNVAYIGGSAEICYWLQYKTMFEQYGVFYPMILMRDSFLLLNQSVIRKMNKLNILLPELFAEESIWQKTQVSRMAAEANFISVQQSMEQSYRRLAEELSVVDTTLKPAALGQLQKQLNLLKNLEAKYLRAWKQKNETRIRQLHEIRETVYPGGELQERHDHLWAYTSYPDHLIQLIINVANPWNQQLKILEV